MLVVTMTKISDLPRDLVEEVLSRVPVTSLRAVRFTCTKWNTFSNDESFTKKHINSQAKKEEVLVIMKVNSTLSLMSAHLCGLGKASSIQPKGTLISLNGRDQVLKQNVLHCDGLLLCITKGNSRLVVWNPYCGQTRWIEPTTSNHWKDNYALGYEMNNISHRNNKVLRILGADGKSSLDFEIYDFDSNSWKVVEVSPHHWIIPCYQRGVTLKGNTYWPAHHESPQGEISNFLLCFDFTREQFGPRLPLPFDTGPEDTLILSGVGKEQLAVLFQNWPMLWTEIWITNKIEPNSVSWGSKFFLHYYLTPLSATAASFFVDQRNKVAVVVHNERNHYSKVTPNTAYIIGEDDYFQKVNLEDSFSFVCSFVPSSVQFEQLAPRGAKRKWNQMIN